ncbi:MAG: hypothetical protein ACRC62_30055 [Microcoleus sp.]
MMTYTEAFSFFLAELRTKAASKNIVLDTSAINCASQIFADTCKASGIPAMPEIKESANYFVENLVQYDS